MFQIGNNGQCNQSKRDLVVINIEYAMISSISSPQILSPTSHIKELWWVMSVSMFCAVPPVLLLASVKWGWTNLCFIFGGTVLGCGLCIVAFVLAFMSVFIYFCDRKQQKCNEKDENEKRG